MSTFAIVSQESNNGAISPLGTTNVNSGQNQDYTITANIGYQIDSVWVDNVSQGAISTYAFINVLATHTIVAIFTPSAGYYCTQGDLISMAGLKTITTLSNDTPNAVTPDPNIIIAMIQKASDYVNAQLSGTFIVPVSPTPGLINSLCTTIAIYFLYQRRPSIYTIPKGWVDLYKDSIDQIQSIKDQEIDLPGVTLIAANSLNITKHHKDINFNQDYNEGYF